jgi:hypothetical protein
MSLILVLTVLSVTVGLACAVLRTQATTVCLSQNTHRLDAARQAAISGLSAAIRRMHVQSQWQGVGSTWSSPLSPTESFTVTYAAGDPRLTSGKADYQDCPYRVTVLSTGYSQDPVSSVNVTTYTIRAIARLVPRKLGNDPSGWSTLAPYSVYQWKPAGSAVGSAFQVDVPCQFEGNVRVKQSLDLCYSYPGSSTVRDRLLKDLNAMRTAGLGDYRPFTGKIYIPTAGLLQSLIDGLTDLLGLSLQNTSSTDTITWAHPGPVSTYQIYPGGPTYSVPTISATLQNVTLGPDPATNPLGLFYSPSRLYVYDNVTVRGTLVTNGSSGDIFVEGTNVAASPVSLPALDGTTTPVQLPVMLVRDDFRVYPGAKASIQGMVAVWDEVEFKQGPQQSTNVTLEGCLLGRQIFVRGRDEWDRSNGWWQQAYDDFVLAQLQGAKYFPVWLQSQKGLQYAPRIHIKPSSSAVTYHWKNTADPIYVAHPSDLGLRWDIVDWKENP